MTNKLLISEYFIFGKESEGNRGDTTVIEDTKEQLEAFWETEIECWDDVNGSKQDFLEGKTIYYSRNGGDWDEPTGGYYTVQSQAEALENAERVYKKSVEKINNTFDKEPYDYTRLLG